jgi:hypothetical protein
MRPLHTPAQSLIAPPIPDNTPRPGDVAQAKGQPAATVPAAAAQPDPVLDRLFAPKPEGYLGADCAMSIPLPDGRTLWLFGDTLMGRMESGVRHWNGMPRNTAAIQPAGPPDSARIEWHLTDAHGAPATFLTVPEDTGSQWFWATSGICLCGELFLFGYGMTVAPGECEALAFRIVEPWLLRIRDTGGSPAAWAIEKARLDWGLSDGGFATACTVAGDFLHLLGVRIPDMQNLDNMSAILARVRVGDLVSRGAGAAFEYWCGPDGGGACAWARDPGRLEPVFRPGVAESTIYFDAPRGRYLATTCNHHEPAYMITTAPAPEGPWSKPRVVFRCSEGQPPERHLFYAFRMHPHLAAHPDEMVCTYVVNARHPEDLLTTPDIYYPRFIRIDLREV